VQQRCLSIALVVAMSGVAHGQEAGARTFETASVRPAPPMSRGPLDFRIQPGGRLTITNLTLRFIICEAFGVKGYQISGGPPWLNSDRFDVVAKADGDPSRSQMMSMLQNLLTDRFRLRMQMETRKTAVYALMLAKGGPKFSRSAAEDSFVRLYRNTPPEQEGVDYTIVAQKVSMAMFADRLGDMQLGRPVLDRTGLKGEFDLKVRYVTDTNAAEGASIFTAIREQLGLRLEATTGPVKKLVIIGAERPSAN
jgi:uncharacterized protein (TIGR03435 family)